VRSILVVDDEANLRHTLAYALRKEGYEVLTAEDGEAALESFKASAPELVILDLMLPKLDGLEVCRWIRRRSDVPKRRVTVDAREVSLTAKEFDLLAYLAGRPGQVLSRDQIVAGVWGVDFSGDPRTVDTHVKTLREHLGDDADYPRWLETVRGVGYRVRDRPSG